MARHVKTPGIASLKENNGSKLSGTLAGILRISRGGRGRPKVLIRGTYKMGNPNPPNQFPPGQTGNPNYRP